MLNSIGMLLDHFAKLLRNPGFHGVSNVALLSLQPALLLCSAQPVRAAPPALPRDALLKRTQIGFAPSSVSQVPVSLCTPFNECGRVGVALDTQVVVRSKCYPTCRLMEEELVVLPWYPNRATEFV
jgi:hypothetical protein